MDWKSIFSIKTLLIFVLTFVALDYLCIFTFVINKKLSRYEENIKGRQLLTSLSSKFQGPSYKFSDPNTAYYILNELDIFSQINLTAEELSTPYKSTYLNYRNDEFYCKKHRALIAYYPETIFEQKNIMTSSFQGSQFFRENIVSPIGNNIGGETRDVPLYDLSLNMTGFFTYIQAHISSAIGIHYSCLSQAVNALPGTIYLHKKDEVAKLVNKYAKNFVSRPQCFSQEKFFPQTWVLEKESQCRAFFKIFNSQDYERQKEARGGIVYIRKLADVHQGKGVFPVDKKEEEIIRNLYRNGENCGKLKNDNVIQYYIHNPFLLNGRKCDFRAYMLIASSNPIIGYYRDGYMRVSLLEYNTESSDRSSLITNIDEAKDIFKVAEQNGTYQGKTFTELIESHQRSYERFHKDLMEAGIVQDPNWLDNYLRPEIKKALVHLIRMGKEKLMSKSSVYQVFGVDFMLDSDLKVWFIEANRGPGFGYKEDPEEIIKGDIQMFQDHFEIVYGLLRSRMKRVVLYVNGLIEKKEAWMMKPGQVFIENLEEKREEFKRLSKNYFEEEFKPGKDNSFEPIIDENVEGKERYFGLLEEECI